MIDHIRPLFIWGLLKDITRGSSIAESDGANFDLIIPILRSTFGFRFRFALWNFGGWYFHDICFGGYFYHGGAFRIDG